MIQRSHRSSPPPVSPGLSLHLQLSRRHVRQRRLLQGGLLAAAVSVVLWLLAVPVAWHLAAAVLAFAGGYLIPTASANRWALGLIGQQAGLSYETALELGDAPDPYGLGSAVRARAEAQVLRVDAPREQPWWLPLALAALLLTLLPVTPFSAAPRSLPFLSEPVAEAPETAPLEQLEPEAPEVVGGQPEPPTPPDTPPAASPPVDTPATLDDLEGAGRTAENGVSDRVADERTLSQFLENLQNRPPPEPETNPFSSVRSQRTPGGDEQEEGEEGDSDTADGAEPGDSQAGEEGAQAQQEQGDSGQQEGEGESSEGEQQAGDESGDGEEAAPEGEPGGGPQPEGEETGPGPADGEQAGDPAEAGETAPDGDEGMEGGLLSSTPVPNDPNLGTPTGDPEFLPGRPQDGPSSLAGTTRLPGDPDAAAALQGAAPSGFARAEEQAIQEGRIPLEYQDIVRNYFQ